MLWQINQFLKPDYPFPAFFPPPVVLEHGGHCQAVGRKVTVHTRGGEATQAGHLRSRPWNRLGTNEQQQGNGFSTFSGHRFMLPADIDKTERKGSNHFNCADFSSENGLYRHNSIALVGSQPAALTPIFSLGVPRSHFYRILPLLSITWSWMFDTLVYVELKTFIKLTVVDASLAFLSRWENLNQAIHLQVLV